MLHNDSGYITHLMVPSTTGWTQQNVWMLALVSLHVKDLMWKNFHFGMIAGRVSYSMCIAI